MAQDAQVKLEGYDYYWATGNDLLTLTVSLGMNEKGSTCKLTLADPGGKHAEALIKHSIENGGIVNLDPPASNGTAGGTFVPAGSSSNVTGAGSFVGSANGAGTVTQGGAFTPQVRAFLDMIAYGECEGGSEVYLTPKSYYSNNGEPGSQGFFDPSAVPPGGGFPTGVAAGDKFNIGRYQFQYHDWQEAQQHDPSITGYTPADQDKVALYKLQHPAGTNYNALAALNSGDIDTALNYAGREWASVPSATPADAAQLRQSGHTKAQYLALYQKRLAFYQSQTPNAALPPAPANTTPQVTTATLAPQVDTSIIKGQKLTVEIVDLTFEYFHQGTEYNQDGITTILGTGIRWVLNKQKRSKSLTGTTLKSLATQIATSHKVKLDWQVPYDVSYHHVAQNGITDYQLLLRECKANGLFISEQGQTLSIKPLTAVTDTDFVIQRGFNLISFDIKDAPLDVTKLDQSGVQPGSSLLQADNKTVFQPLQAQAVQTKLNIDSAPSVGAKDITGQPVPPQKGTTDAASTLLATQSQARVARVQGLPSVFKVNLTYQTLQLQPLQAVRTKGFPGVLSRIWMVDTVVHNVGEGYTELHVYTPIEAKTLTLAPQVPNINTPQAVATNLPHGTWLVPVGGVITSPWGMRDGRLHDGVDIAPANGQAGDPVYASRDGVCTGGGAGNYDDGGYGNWVQLTHADGSITQYGHFRDVPSIRQGMQVKQGQQIGVRGTSGHSTGVHTHWRYKPPGASVGVDPGVVCPSVHARGATVTALNPG